MLYNKTVKLETGIEIKLDGNGNIKSLVWENNAYPKCDLPINN
jgi:hypothetical protein